MVLALIFLLTAGLGFVMFKVFVPKKPNGYWTTILVTQTTIIFSLLVLYFLFSFYIIENFYGVFQRNVVGQVIAFVLNIPFIIPFLIGFGGQEILAYLSILGEILILTFLLRPLISTDIVNRVRRLLANNGT